MWQKVKRGLKIGGLSLALVASYTIGYWGSGYFHGVRRAMDYGQAKGKGHYDRTKDSRFRKEFGSEMRSLRSKLKDFDTCEGAKRCYTLDVAISEDLKWYYDNASDDNDNSSWIDYVAGSFNELKEYKRAGIGFRVNNVYGITSDKPIMFTDLIIKTRVTGEYLLNSKSDMVMIFLPRRNTLAIKDGKVVDLKVEGLSIRGTYLKHGYVVLSHNKHLNGTTTRHEMGHLLGMGHRTVRQKKIKIPLIDKEIYIQPGRDLIDPFCILRKDSFMRPEPHPCAGKKLMDDEIEFLKDIHVRGKLPF